MQTKQAARVMLYRVWQVPASCRGVIEGRRQATKRTAARARVGEISARTIACSTGCEMVEKR